VQLTSCAIISLSSLLQWGDPDILLPAVRLWGCCLHCQRRGVPRGCLQGRDVEGGPVSRQVQRKSVVAAAALPSQTLSTHRRFVQFMPASTHPALSYLLPLIAGPTRPNPPLTLTRWHLVHNRERIDHQGTDLRTTSTTRHKRRAAKRIASEGQPGSVPEVKIKRGAEPPATFGASTETSGECGTKATSTTTQYPARCR
jgi:hypothetical protein